MNLSSAKEFIRNLEEEKINIDVCDLSNATKIVQLIDEREVKKDSASPTEIVFGELIAKLVKNRLQLPVSIKIFYNDIEPDVGGLFYEYRMYKMITDTIINTGICPNFVPYIAFGCCKDNDKEKCFLITERAGNGAQFNRNKIYPIKTFHDTYKNLSQRESQQLLFQVIYALTVMQRFEISHNDLHLGNILVMIMDEPVVLNYIADGTIFKIQTKYIAYMYDWDIGSQTKLGDNPKISEFFKELNITGQYVPIRDIYTLFCYIGDIKGVYIPHSVASYSNHPVLKQVENSKKMLVRSEQLEELKKLSPQPNRTINIDGIMSAVYKLSESEFNSIFQHIKAPVHSKDVFFVVQGRYIEFWNPFYCRISNTSTTFQTPEQVLISFKMFQTNKVDTPFVYRLPTKKEADSLIDKFIVQNPIESLDKYKEIDQDS